MKFPQKWTVSVIQLEVVGLLGCGMLSDATVARSRSSDFAQRQTAPEQRATAPDQRKAPIASSPSVEKVAEIGGSRSITFVQLSSDRKKVFASMPGRSFVWEPAKSEGMKVVNCGIILGEGNSCVSPRFGLEGMKVLETTTGRELYVLSKKNNEDVVVSPLGTYLTVEDATEGIDLFDSKNGTRIARLASSWGFKNVTFSQDESLLAASDAARFVVYDLKRKKARKIDVTSVGSLALSSKGNFLWAASYYAAPQVLTTGGKRISREFPEEFSSRYEHSVFGSFMDSDSKVVMKTALGDVGVWDWKSNKVIELPAKVERLSVAESGFLTVTEGGVAELWDRNLKKVFTFEGLLNRAIITFDGTGVVTVTRDGTLTLWEVRMRKEEL